MDNKVVHFNTIILIVLKELRRERFVHRATLAEACGKSLSAWNKIESGESPLSMALFHRICHCFDLQPSEILSAVDNIVTLFEEDGYAVIYNEDNIDGDTIINKIDGYYKEHPHKMNSYSILSIYDSAENLTIPEVIAWCLGRM